MADSPLCPEDGTPMIRDTKPQNLSYRGESVTVDMPGWYCPVCGEGLHTGQDMKVSDRALVAMKAKVEKLLPPEEIRRIRKRLGLTQQAAGEIIGGGPKAFTKYERGDLLPSRAVVSALRLLDARPEGLAVLSSAAQAPTGPGRGRRSGPVAGGQAL